MDSATAALIGAGIGMMGAILTALLAARNAHVAGRREQMREAYAVGLQKINKMIRSGFSASTMAELVEAHAQIELLGSRDASSKITVLIRAVDKQSMEHKMKAAMIVQLDFIAVARRDLKVDSRMRYRIRQFNQRRSIKRLRRLVSELEGKGTS